MANDNCMEKLFASPIFWTLMGLQAVGTGGFIVLAVTMDMKYMGEQDSPGTTFLAACTVIAIPAACFCFFFAGVSFFNVFCMIFSCKKVIGFGVSGVFPLFPGKNKITATLVTTISQEGEAMV